MGLKLGDFSPIAGVLTGEGMVGKIAGEGMLGLGPKFIANQAQDEDERKEKEKKARRGTAAQQIDSTTTSPAFKKGGKVSSASKRADGCALRGKTRA